jgi:hypothetical protein
MREIGHFIGGRHVPGTSGNFGNVFNPASGLRSSVPNLQSATAGAHQFRATSFLFSVSCLSRTSAAQCDELRGQDTRRKRRVART